MSKTATTKVYLKQKLYGMKMQEGSDLVEYMNAFNQVVADLACLGATIDDEDRVILLLCSLPSSYDHLITTLSHGKETVKNEDITAALLSYHMRKKNAMEVTHGGGDIKIKTFDGVERMLRGVRHVPGLRRNLISLGVLHDGGMVFRCDQDKKNMKMMEDEVTVMIGARTDSHLYKLQGSTIAGGVTETGVAGVAAGSHGGSGSGADSSGSSR
ncbi:Retrovirus-related Pol polyprotein from transposon TNT 1-94 [Hordeum vulgare]|nr:Retrovirus-related Pol polyprotein from transposon TNT 1-94 [Hordeum vulgare]